jgi:hypothetical protein
MFLIFVLFKKIEFFSKKIPKNKKIQFFFLKKLTKSKKGICLPNFESINDSMQLVEQAKPIEFQLTCQI